MGALRDQAGSRVLLRARHVVGREAGVDLLIDRPEVSRMHASIGWTGRVWELRDLGSRNGTWVDQRKVDPGENVLVSAGSVLAFGNPRNRYVLEDVGAPAMYATCGDEVAEAADELLMLPTPDNPEILVHREPRQGWVVERDDQTTPAQDRDPVVVSGKRWTLHLPSVAAPTGFWAADKNLASLKLEFAVSSDEEYVEVTVHTGGETHTLAPRAHHYLMLTLARQRLKDAEDGDAEAEQGWLYVEDLQKMLRATSNQLYVSIHRARKEIQALEIAGAEELVQRRTTTRQVRLGVAQVSVRRL